MAKTQYVLHKEMSDEMLVWSEKIREISVASNNKRDKRIDKLEEKIEKIMLQIISFESIKSDIEEIKEAIKTLVTNKEFSLVQKIVFGAVTFILISVAGSAGAAILYFLTIK